MDGAPNCLDNWQHVSIHRNSSKTFGFLRSVFSHSKFRFCPNSEHRTACFLHYATFVPSLRRRLPHATSVPKFSAQFLQGERPEFVIVPTFTKAPPIPQGCCDMGRNSGKSLSPTPHTFSPHIATSTHIPVTYSRHPTPRKNFHPTHSFIPHHATSFTWLHTQRHPSSQENFHTIRSV